MEMDSKTSTGPGAIGFAVTWAAVITVTCVLIGEGAAQYVGLNAPVNGELVAEGPAKSAPPNFNTIDLATTGSIKGQTIVISPCTGKPTEP